MENSIIIPIFTIVIALLITLCFYMHDSVIIKNTAVKLCIRQEFEEADTNILINTGQEYIKEKTLCATEALVKLKDTGGKYTCYAEAVFFSNMSAFGKRSDIKKNAIIEKNKPDEFIRMLQAAAELSEISN